MLASLEQLLQDLFHVEAPLIRQFALADWAANDGEFLFRIHHSRPALGAHPVLVFAQVDGWFLECFKAQWALQNVF